MDNATYRWDDGDGHRDTQTADAFETTPPWVTAEPHVETFMYATPDWTDPTPLAEIESPLVAAYVKYRLLEIPMAAAHAAARYAPGEATRRVAVFEDIDQGWEILFATRPGHVFTAEEFKTFLADVGHYLRGEVWWINEETVYASTPREAAIRYLDSRP